MAKSMPKWLLLLILGIVAALIGIFLWDTFIRQPGKEQIQAIQEAAKQREAALAAELARVARQSRQRDTIIDAAAVEERAQEIASDLASNRIAQLRQQLGVLTEVRDSNAVLLQLDRQHESRHLADTVRINRLIVQRDTLRADRDDWKRSSGRLLAEVRRLNTDIDSIVGLALHECSYLIVKLPCPTLVLGPGVGVSGTGVFHAGLQITAGIPIRLGRKPSPPQATVSDLELSAGR